MSYFTAAARSLALAAFPALVPAASGCEVLFLRSSENLVSMADTIVVATHVAYAKPSALKPLARAQRQEHPIRFRVTETLRGAAGGEITLPGILSDRDDFNDRPVPYNQVRPGGHGVCFANTYRAGAQYLLLLRTNEAEGLNLKWAPSSPVNEQLHAEGDPWLRWVRKQIRSDSEAPR